MRRCSCEGSSDQERARAAACATSSAHCSVVAVEELTTSNTAGAVGEQGANPIGDDLLHLGSWDPIGARSLGPSSRNQWPRDVIAVALAGLHRMRRAHAVAKTVEDQPSQQARLLRRASCPSVAGIGGQMRLGLVPQRLIDDRRMLAGIMPVLVDDLAAGRCGSAASDRARRGPNGWPPQSTAAGCSATAC